MQIIKNEEKNRVIVYVDGRIDTLTASDFEKQLIELINNKDVIIECSKIEYISSAGLRSLLVLEKLAAVKKINIVLCRLPELVREVLEISGFDSFFEVRNDFDR